MTDKATAQQVMRQMFADLYPEAEDTALDAVAGVVTAAAKPGMTAADSTRLRSVLELLGFAEPSDPVTSPPPAVVKVTRRGTSGAVRVVGDLPSSYRLELGKLGLREIAKPAASTEKTVRKVVSMKSTNPTVSRTRRSGLTGAARQDLAKELKRKYEAGASIRALADETGRSYGFVQRLLGERGTLLRGRRKQSPET